MPPVDTRRASASAAPKDCGRGRDRRDGAALGAAVLAVADVAAAGGGRFRRRYVGEQPLEVLLMKITPASPRARPARLPRFVGRRVARYADD